MSGKDQSLFNGLIKISNLIIINHKSILRKTNLCNQFKNKADRIFIQGIRFSLPITNDSKIDYSDLLILVRFLAFRFYLHAYNWSEMKNCRACTNDLPLITTRWSSSD